MEQEAVSEGQKQDKIAPGFLFRLFRKLHGDKKKGGPVIAVAQFLVWVHGVDNLPYYHQRVCLLMDGNMPLSSW
jgi:hypothetical protein